MEIIVLLVFRLPAQLSGSMAREDHIRLPSLSISQNQQDTILSSL